MHQNWARPETSGPRAKIESRGSQYEHKNYQYSYYTGWTLGAYPGEERAWHHQKRHARHDLLAEETQLQLVIEHVFARGEEGTDSIESTSPVKSHSIGLKQFFFSSWIEDD